MEVDERMLKAFTVALGEYDVKEWSGSKHNPEVMKYFIECGFDNIKDDETSWCLKGETELLTNKGFVKFEDAILQSEIKVAQLNTDDNSVEFTDNFGWVVKSYNGEIYNINKKSINISCDPNHEFYGKWSSSGGYKKRKISSITSYGVAIPPICSSSSDYSISDRDLMLMAAFLSDGHISFNRLNFGVSKSRKIKILSSLNPIWEKDRSKAYSNRKLIRNFSFAYPEVFKKCFSEYKVLTWEFISSLSQRQCKLFIDTYSNFDGHPQPNMFSIFTACDKLAENLIYIASMAGYKATLSKVKQVSRNTTIEYLNTIYVSIKNRHKYIMKNHIEKEQFKGHLYCVQVPSGVFVIRDKNKNIIPIGNCAAAMCWDMMKVGLPHTKSLVARDWLAWGDVIYEPIFPCVVCLSREGSSWMGHVGWWIKTKASNVWVYGGNQSNTYCVSKYNSSNILGYRTWLKK